MEHLQRLGRDELLEVLSEGFCSNCQSLLQTGIRKICGAGKISNGKPSSSSDDTENSGALQSANGSSLSLLVKSSESMTISGRSQQQESNPSSSNRTKESVYPATRKGYAADSSPSSAGSVSSKRSLLDHSGSEIWLNDGLSRVSSPTNSGLSEDQKEKIRISKVGRKKDFAYNEIINGKMTNVLQGLELHTDVFNSEEQKTIVQCVYNLQQKGQRGQLQAERTYSAPRKWMRGKGRITMQFGCCYNYVVDKDGNPPGIIRDEEVDPLPSLFKQMIRRMVRWQVLPSTCVPNSCIVNIYYEGDCIPPHIDHHDFLRPFCTVSFLTKCNILFGSNLKILSPGEFSGPVSIPLPVGSVLVLNGNGADVAKHCVPSVPAKRISITFRKMDDNKLPFKFLPDPELRGARPAVYSSVDDSQIEQHQHQHQHQHRKKGAHDGSGSIKQAQVNSFVVGKDDFPPLGSSKFVKQPGANKNHR
ncbi:RNA demethylase ALKBH9B-like isoform X1 [Malania oleifera]|uniref:RNA demethylase ALKBH9B-like isoform X1 n=1 Tax=Malania oleifera TaxID=397392 RepID=UPI0025AE25EE|nr:RNA demethylase ALKBH9B-like isoform X1 [Malania oleifera]XP_057970793.1 RNA demethylase ALKBH9B-like isoform X1 [Malania oleifera]